MKVFVSFDLSHSEGCIRFLIKHRLVESREGMDGFFKITTPGELFVKFLVDESQQGYPYTRQCKKEIENLVLEYGEKRNPVFLEVSRKHYPIKLE